MDLGLTLSPWYSHGTSIGGTASNAVVPDTSDRLPAVPFLPLHLDDTNTGEFVFLLCEVWGVWWWFL